MNVSLYELTADLQNVLDLAATAETDDDRQAIADTLEGIGGEIKTKLLGCACVVRMLDTQAVVVKAEEERLERRRKALESSVDRLKAYMKTAMETAMLDKVKGDLFTVAIQLNPPKLVVDDAEMIPGVYVKTKTSTSIDARAILEAIAAGREIPARMP